MMAFLQVRSKLCIKLKEEPLTLAKHKPSLVVFCVYFLNRWKNVKSFTLWFFTLELLESLPVIPTIHTTPYLCCRRHLKWHLPLLTLVPLCELVTWTPFVIAGRKWAFARFGAPDLLQLLALVGVEWYLKVSMSPHQLQNKHDNWPPVVCLTSSQRFSCIPW